MSARLLKGCRVLILEDDFYQAMDIRGSLQQAGAEIVACRGTVPDLDELMARNSLDIALLDINLGGTQSFDFARALDVEGIPCVFLTGYDVTILPADLRHARFISKPVDGPAVVDALRQVYIAKLKDSDRADPPIKG